MIRAGRPEDLPAIAALHDASWQEVYRGLLPEDYLGSGARDLLAHKWATMPEAALFVAESGGGLDGFIAVENGDAAYVDALHVAAGARGTGLGRALLARAARQARDWGCAGLWLTLLAGNDPADRFYRALGAVETWRGPDPDFPVPVEAIRLDWSDLSRLIEAG